MTWTAPAVDRPQGPNTAGERVAAENLLDHHRATLLAKCAGLTGDQLATRAIPPSTMSLLGLVLHMIEEYARHNGHAGLLRECVDGVTGE